VTLPAIAEPPPPGMLRQTVTYLEMGEPPARAAGRDAAAPAVRLEDPVRLSLVEYRALQRAVGEQWLWWERLALDDEALAAIVHDARVEIRRLWTGNALAGFSEIDRRDPADVEIAFLGLVPAAIGRGLGRVLLQATLEAAWSKAPRRVWLHTCDHDHPKALAFYQDAGFRIVRVETLHIPDPRLCGLLPPSAGPHVPRSSTPLSVLRQRDG
jgi:GNAT superfamily N-acetyltransferase